MTKKSFLLIITLLLLVIIVGCTKQTAAPTPGALNQNQAPSASNAVAIEGFVFTPQTLTVKIGTTVTWTNNHTAPHQIKSATFNSSLLTKGQSFTFTFNEVGTYDYVCAIHSNMKGKIIVN